MTVKVSEDQLRIDIYDASGKHVRIIHLYPSSREMIVKRHPARDWVTATWTGDKPEFEDIIPSGRVRR